MQDTKGLNPYKFGFGAASDSHNTGVPYRQDNFFGGHTFTDGTIRGAHVRHSRRRLFRRAHRGHRRPDRRVGRGEHARILFEAMQRKETFAVSGPHIKVRLFGGWEYTRPMPWPTRTG